MQMTEARALDLSTAPVVDAHCHGFRVEDLLALDPGGWLDRITLMGMCFQTSKTADPRLAEWLSAMTANSVFAKYAERALAEHLQCEVEEVQNVRSSRLRFNAQEYLSRLLEGERVVALFADDGYPQPRVDASEVETLVSTPVYRVARLEPIIEEARSLADNLVQFEDAFRALLEQAGSDPRCIAYKTVIAYRTGLDIGEPTKDDVAGAFSRWRKANWRDGRDTSKAVRDHLIHAALEVAARQDGRPLHIHSGGGDPDVVLSHARPTHLGPLIKRWSHHPIVLIHCGFPWVAEAAYLASIYPRVYLELSIYVPWTTLDIDRALTTALGLVPANKLLYGSDEASEPEVIWLAARLGRRALERVLRRAVEFEYLSAGDAQRMGEQILSVNALALHGAGDTGSGRVPSISMRAVTSRG